MFIAGFTFCFMRLMENKRYPLAAKMTDSTTGADMHYMFLCIMTFAFTNFQTLIASAPANHAYIFSGLEIPKRSNIEPITTWVALTSSSRDSLNSLFSVITWRFS